MLNQSVKKLESIINEAPELGPLQDFIKKLLNFGDQKNEIKTVIEFLEELIKYMGHYGSYGSFNFFPSDAAGSCHELCIGIATKPFEHKYYKNEKGNRTGFKGMIKEIIAYWFNCYDKNKTTLLITPEWRETVFQENWKKIIDAYVKKGRKVIIIEIISLNDYIRRY